MDTHPLADRTRPTRCPRCSALVRGDVPWCLVCYAAFTADPVRVPDADPTPPTQPVGVPEADRTGPTQPVGVPDADPTPPTRPAPAPDVDALADQLLAALAATGQRPAWGRRLPASRAGRAALATGLLAGSSGVLLAVMSALGHLL